MEFKESTVLMVAHRLNTILNSDVIVVMNDGRVAECGPPNELLQDQYGQFTALLKDSATSASAAAAGTKA
jgi:ABC-type multidrug transport system fused ATPase/permease subunit